MPEPQKSRNHLTTSEAARILGVAPDTVLKWVKAGKVRSRRTLGGHFRIPSSELEKFVSDAGGELKPLLSEPTIHQYCWEFLASGGEIRAECRDCITYRSRASRCYELKDLPDGLGCLNLMCDTDCAECDYYRVVRGQGINVIALSHTGKLVSDLSGSSKSTDIEVRFARSEYEVASLIQQFRPDFIVVDCSFGKRRTVDLCGSLFGDIRIPVPRIILASKSRNISDYCDREVFGWIRKPFTLEQLRACIQGIPALIEQT